MPSSCCVMNCSNKGDSGDKHLFKFPKDEKVRDVWINAVGHNLKNGTCDNKNLFICNKHFDLLFSRSDLLLNKITTCYNVL
ncbi:52 kDa repressor of the inhibitor of the protein kinase-like [Leptopilina boulardi]|uniref:52 kDa repressor of the inhibitor of the protein kinase-like n=1 Tax=Leptopilina boulardi TaxID=63433 RepID=UPI0021F58877|nr:52 kDa repressor of the inhibitor of the protein kinase-like [Leptopilina boulardi]XP_051160070.1 52 kDa repressor of the inhibitor of the protein kinase-like [Leptopilina boulardi]XP_051160766.1 52 kDa repressor of the inhibitor of the protein kinase-like [Leptopilina boulardi]XP_051164580.1 52 kDa repressor of the inhibitor of the protein kinase-like [Leptopilina boulardi]XP_051169399.1 52 kDa repressor of the inhibitor of the protein kinase-like [Leptopilina boulardi]